ncbi:response regulator transcription factor [Fulvivirgaceae bacterium BMA12]|uniref:Response regulator transcription factor n=1 Tax=Agaribacillus aureus TaxID=3051825 RepID=A0ABT8L4E8_9BACT|nr:response regulator transcription factor [Fulvivirgaceae bacterium BMA12]
MKITQKKGKKILLVEDDTNLGYVIKDNLEVAGFEVIWCENGEEGLRYFFEQGTDLCVLDVMLPKMDGFTMAREIRKTDEVTPIIFLTAKAMKEDKINGFTLGGDDYITKPFSIEELILRIEVFLKRADTKPATAPLTQLGQYKFDYQNLILSCNDWEKKLTQKEADILRIFCQKKGQVVRREDILKDIWGDDDYFLGRSLDVFISKLRKYLQEDQSLSITNFHGVGFKLEIKD